MPVIINDFEIVVEPPETPGPPTATKDEPSQGNAPTVRPEDIVRVMQLHAERAARLCAD
ncbi:MAG TPA: hypothetical protein VM911_14510 [Pyrinomonadaceae bacterium]|nr:hypothetical protein [Pyrinomonadaceae bacterium]